ncbi:hypothetical protein BJ165DRAFT_183053 [Panaeolus papilionaceus]|nr:hypothetical protein BJ165DRAFT_183053 [Panaeolus papilionaceus]
MITSTTLAMEDMLKTYGALLFGGSVAFGLSGILMVIVVWALDGIHSCLILTSLFFYLIKFFGMNEYINHIPWPLALTVIVTAIQTFIAHCSFSYKIFRASKRNFKIIGPILFLALFRLVAAAVSTAEMLRLRRFSAFTERYPGWIFTLGLALSSVVDVMITSWLCYFLRTLKENIPGDSTLMMRMVDVLTLYTLENGLLPCIVAMASLICWFAMPRNLIFLGLHLIIGKLYANSLLASLNVRQELRQIHIGIGSRSQQPWSLSPTTPGYIGYQPGPLYTIKEVTTEEYVEDDSGDHDSDNAPSAAFLHLSAVAPHASAR